MALDLATDLQPIAQQHRPQLGNQLLTGIARLAKGTPQIPLQAGSMARGVDLLMGPGGAERGGRVEAGAIRQLDPIDRR